MKDTREKPLAILTGPTASGKSDVSLALAERFDGEIVSADSMQIYRGMDIGTAKLPLAQRRGIPHHLMDIVEPTESFSVADYVARAREAMDGIYSRGHLPIVVGGTGLYINALINPYNLQPAAARDPAYRQILKSQFDIDQGETLHRQLQAIDPQAAQRIHPHDAQRLFRALEVYRATKQTMSQWQSQNEQPPAYRLAFLALTMDRQRLYERIDARVEQMLAGGLAAEVEGLLRQGVSPQCQSMQGIGYRQMVAWLQGDIPYEQAVGWIKRDTRRYAKRQYTWFKRDPRILWLSREEYPEEEIPKQAAAALLKAFEEA
ncbi:MAG: tRNA (adenosine(37)-N6)-dimethylallyltransferase MiaA [Firmicutes bacterium]|nr:tRNA (adenosine(37)-N6)-dimethylallyltransferase MiaA [Bacillota bacterium]